MNILYVILALLLALGFYVIVIYNGLQTLLTQIEAAIQEIGNQLKRQAGLIPNLQNSVKAYLKQEKDIFQMLSDARKDVADAAEKTSAKTLDKVERDLQQIIPKLQIAVEDNPELKSNETVQQFMAELRDTSDKLMYSRRAVIDLTQNFNQQLVTFPSNVIAGVFGFKKQPGFATAKTGPHVEISTAEMEEPKVNL